MRTLTNAIATGRIAHAFMLTGVRGVGKTTTARIIARALNCIGPDGKGGPTAEPCGVCEHCVGDRRGPPRRRDRDGRRLPHRRRRRARADRRRALPPGCGALQGLHHRRSPHALEERVQRAAEDARGAAARTSSSSSPPPRSARCRSPCCRAASASICAGSSRDALADASRRHRREGEASRSTPDALALIARAADGSVRDGLSLLDQAHRRQADGEVDRRAGSRDMLGPGRPRPVFDLLRARDGGSRAAAAGARRATCTAPAPIRWSCCRTCWSSRIAITRLKLVPELRRDADLPEAERGAAPALAEQLVDAGAGARLADAAEGRRRGAVRAAADRARSKWC